MSKLTEIKEKYESHKKYLKSQPHIPEISVNLNLGDLEYLLSLLEEKDKALAFCADKETWNKPGVDQSEIARTALNTTKEVEL